MLAFGTIMRPLRSLRLWWSLRLLIVLLMLSHGVLGYCPHGCGCDDNSLAVTCLKTEMQVMPISLNPSIKSLVLKYNNFTAVDASMSFYPFLEKLDLSNNSLQNLPDRIFSSQQKLRILVLSWNRISSLNSFSLKGLKSLTKLDLSNNLLTSLTDGCFSDLHSLQELDLSMNRINVIAPQTFSWCLQLKKLDLSNNRLESLQPPETCKRQENATESDINQTSASKADGDEDCSSWLSKLEALEQLSLASNMLQSLADFANDTKLSLKTLDLSNNQLEGLGNSSLTSMPNLKTLLLSHNAIKTFPTRALSACGFLERLVLSHNPLVEIPANCLMANHQLKYLDISNCQRLTHIQPQAFALNSQLFVVSMSHNPQVVEIPVDAFPIEDNNIKHLDISNNAISALDGDLAWLSDMENLQLAGNPWHCDCGIKSVRSAIAATLEWQGNHPRSQSGGPRWPIKRVLCYSPIIYRDIDLLDLDLSGCESGGPIPINQATIVPTMEDMEPSEMLHTSTTVLSIIIVLILAITIVLFLVLCVGKRHCSKTAVRCDSSVGTDETYCQLSRGKNPPSRSSQIDQHLLYDKPEGQLDEYQPKPPHHHISDFRGSGLNVGWDHHRQGRWDWSQHSPLLVQPPHDEVGGAGEVSDDPAAGRLRPPQATAPSQRHDVIRVGNSPLVLWRDPERRRTSGVAGSEVRPPKLSYSVSFRHKRPQAAGRGEHNNGGHHNNNNNNVELNSQTMRTTCSSNASTAVSTTSSSGTSRASDGSSDSCGSSAYNNSFLLASLARPLNRPPRPIFRAPPPPPPPSHWHGGSEPPLDEWRGSRTPQASRPPVEFRRNPTGRELTSSKVSPYSVTDIATGRQSNISEVRSDLGVATSMGKPMASILPQHLPIGSADPHRPNGDLDRQQMSFRDI